MNILNRLGVNSLRMLSIVSFLLCVSCNEQDCYIKNAIQGDASVCPIIFTPDSSNVLIDIFAQDFLEMLEENSIIMNPKKELFQSLKMQRPIKVSNKLYKELSSNRIYVDSTTNSVYKQLGVCGLFNKYFKKETLFGGVYILVNPEQIFPLVGEKPYPSFGLGQNISYIIYLLSKHNIYLRHLWVDEGGITMTILAEDLSDMSQLTTLH